MNYIDNIGNGNKKGKDPEGSFPRKSDSYGVCVCFSLSLDSPLTFLFNKLLNAYMLQGQAPGDHIDRLSTVSHDFLHIHVALVEIREKLLVEEDFLDVFGCSAVS